MLRGGLRRRNRNRSRNRSGLRSLRWRSLRRRDRNSSGLCGLRWRSWRRGPGSAALRRCGQASERSKPSLLLRFFFLGLLRAALRRRWQRSERSNRDLLLFLLLFLLLSFLLLSFLLLPFLLLPFLLLLPLLFFGLLRLLQLLAEQFEGPLSLFLGRRSRLRRGFFRGILQHDLCGGDSTQRHGKDKNKCGSVHLM